jgi:hypothetical protein
MLISPAWLWFCLRARSLWFFSASNPAISFGGYVGERKEDVYNLMPKGVWPNSIFIKPDMSITEIVRGMDTASLHFPVAVKPASGLMGFMFRKVDSISQLMQYHAAMEFDYILQEFVDLPLEVSVFYYRMPNERTGTITGFIRKEFLKVTGDGHRTLKALIEQCPRVQFKLDEMKGKHSSKLNDVIPDGQDYPLSYALNLSRGGKLVSLEHEKDVQMANLFDRLSHHAGFYYGRYDIRCQTIEDLKAGKNFTILEFNGCGGEPHHVYGNHNTLFKACKILVQHWHKMYLISKQHHALGTPYWPHKKAWPYMKEMLRYIIRLKKLDHAFEFSDSPSKAPEEIYLAHKLVPVQLEER